MQKIDFSLIKFDDKGLVPVVVQDAVTAEVLMTAWANREALEETAARGEMVFWSRSRNALWRKGETSGNTMKLLALRADCDGDTLLAQVEPAGPACHTGERSCFYRNLWGASADEATFLGRLWKFLELRKEDDPKESYTARLLASGLSRVAQKVGEEGVEAALACATKDRDGFRYEAADLLYHLLVACIASGVPLPEVLRELASRHKGAQR
ncbi:MAG: bifunctional phosphoribosyl-AMP cyclohydrolase/phosphoribosyl-ATP diphosphatase HisIE [Cloacibacillus sp.]